MKRPSLRRMAGWVLGLAILFFLARTLYSSWGEVTASGFQFRFDLPLLAISFVLLVIGRGFAVEAWRRILIALGDYVPFRFAFYAWFVSNLARYIPGNIWQLAAMMVLVERAGVSRLNVLLSQAVYAAIALSVAALFGLTLLPNVRPELASTPFMLVAALVFLGLIIFFALPPVFRLMVHMAAHIMQWLRRRVIPETLHKGTTLPVQTFARGLIPPLCSSAMWMINGLAFYLFVRSISDIPADALPTFAAMNAGAYFIGYVSFITPSGLGFREGALALMLGAFFPPPIAVAISFLTRIWSTAGELLGVGIAVWGAPRSPHSRLAAQGERERMDTSPLPQ